MGCLAAPARLLLMLARMARATTPNTGGVRLGESPTGSAENNADE